MSRLFMTAQAIFAHKNKEKVAKLSKNSKEFFRK